MQSILEKKEIIDSTYEVLFFMGKDSFSETYRVKDRNKNIYTLELHNSSKLERNDFIQDNLLEVNILSSLNINGITNLITHGNLLKNNQKYHYLILDFISGETLQDKISREGPQSQYYAIPLVLYILEILKKIHSQVDPIIHNNINLNSIYLEYIDNKEMPILTDFRFARYMTSKNNSLNLNRLSPFYIAPELYNGIFTQQSDLFSVGVLLYNLIMGIPPWYVELTQYQHTDEKFLEALNSKRNEPLNFSINGIDELDDGHLKEVIKKALAINIDNRFKNTDEFISALKREKTIIPNSEKSNIEKKIVTKEGSGFSAIAGMQDLKDILYSDVIRALNEKELYASYGITIPNGMLLYGPPGCGKTFISERFAEEVGFNFLQLNPSDIKSKYINETEEKINTIFKKAEESAPTIIFIDEIDAVVPNRENDLNQMQAAPVNEFLAQMSNCSEKGIFVIAASNRPEKIDPAILRTGRIDRMIYLPPPDYEARVSMFKLYLEKRPIDLGLNYNNLAKMTENYVSSDIKFLIDEASRNALKLKARITQDIFNEVIRNTKPSISKNEIEKYEILRDSIENKDEPNNHIGFVN